MDDGQGTGSSATREADLAALERFVVGNRDLQELEQRLGGFNMFEALGNVRREERHSDFLAFLLDPSQPHGLDDLFLRAFLQAALDGAPDVGSPFRAIDVALLDLADARAEREWNAIDILVTCDAERFVVLVENKVGTDEHSNQLARYLRLVRSRFAGWRVLPVFLTADGHRPRRNAEFHTTSYSRVHGELSALLAHQRNAMSPDVEVAVRHYVQMLERHIMEDTDIARLARKIYERHRRALDVIFEHRPDTQELVRQKLVELVSAEPATDLLYASKSLVQFTPTRWVDVPALATGGDGTWLQRAEMLRFEFRQQSGLSLHLTIGPGDPALRQSIFDESGRPAHQADKALFKHRSAQLYAKTTQIWREAVYSSAQDTDMPLEDRLRKIDEVWNHFVAGTLPKLTQVFVDL